VGWLSLCVLNIVSPIFRRSVTYCEPTVEFMQQVFNLFSWFADEPIRVLFPAMFILTSAALRLFLSRRRWSIRLIFAACTSSLWLLYGYYEAWAADYNATANIRLDIGLAMFVLTPMSVLALLLLILPDRTKRFVSSLK